MAIYRPYESKRRLRDAMNRGYWYEPNDMSCESRQAAERLFVHMRIRYPWSAERINGQAEGEK